MVQFSVKTALLGMAVLVVAASTGWAGGRPSCSKCGSGKSAHRICRPVCTTKLVQTTCWDYATQDFCVPCKNGKCHDDCECDQQGKGRTDQGDTKQDGKARDRSCPLKAACYDAIPHRRNRLIKKTCLERVPVTVWVTEYICEGCGESIGKGQGSPTKEPSGLLPPPITSGQGVPLDEPGEPPKSKPSAVQLLVVPDPPLLAPPSNRAPKPIAKSKTGPVEFRLSDLE